MLVEKIEVTKNQLNAGCQYKHISGVVLTVDTRKSFYRTSAIEFYNGSGNQIYFAPMSDNEYTTWIAEPGISSLIPVRDSTLKTMSDLVDGISYIVCSGLAGHTSGVVFSVMKERW